MNADLTPTAEAPEQPSYASDFDPVTLAVIANRLDGVCREMTNTLLRSARSSVLALGKDFSCSIVSSEDDLLAAAEGIPVHVIGSGALTKVMSEFHPDLQPGDAFLHNDPYLGNTHPADHTILVPVFVEGEHVFTACSKAHQADCGNALPTTYMPTAQDVYEEGSLTFPCVRIQRDYQDVEDIIRMAKARIRVPEQWYGDYLATLGAARVAERALQELGEKYGLETIRNWIREWLDYSEARMEQEIRRLPSGQWTARTFHDPFPGVPEHPEHGLPINATVTVDAEEAEVTVDLTDNIDSLPNGLNQSETTATASAVAGIWFSISEVPHNAGSFRRINVKLREGSVAGIPVFPSSCSMATGNVASEIVNAVQSAVSAAGAQYGLAEGAGGCPPATAVVSGVDQRAGRDEPFVTQLFVSTMGGPGGPETDGWLNYLMPSASGALYTDSVEGDEQKFPMVIRERRVRMDSEGAGRRRGAPGSISTYGPTESAALTCNYSLTAKIHPPKGVRGGGTAGANEAFLVSPDGAVKDLPELVAQRELQDGELIGSRTAGGGGYGFPWEREPERVLWDVVEGYVSRERAEAVYGVVFSEEGSSREPLRVDFKATQERRDTLARDAGEST